MKRFDHVFEAVEAVKASLLGEDAVDSPLVQVQKDFNAYIAKLEQLIPGSSGQEKQDYEFRLGYALTTLSGMGMALDSLILQRIVSLEGMDQGSGTFSHVYNALCDGIAQASCGPAMEGMDMEPITDIEKLWVGEQALSDAIDGQLADMEIAKQGLVSRYFAGLKDRSGERDR